MNQIPFSQYKESIHQMFDMVIEIKTLHLPEETSQWILRHVFMDIFESTREYLYFLISNHKENFNISSDKDVNPRINLHLLIKKTNLNHDKNYLGFVEKCKDFNDLRNHLVHRNGFYYTYEEDKENMDLKFDFPACPDDLNLRFRTKSPLIKGRLDGHRAIYPYGKKILLESRDIVNLIFFMGLNVERISKSALDEQFRDEFIEADFCLKAKYIYDAL